MLTGLKASSLARKCVFYRPKLIGKGGAHGIEISRFTTENQPQLGKIFKRIWKVLSSFFMKYYGLSGSDLSLAGCQHLKIQDFGILLLTEHLFLFLPTISHERLTSNPTIFCKNSIRSFTCILPKFWQIFFCYQREIPKISHFGHFKDHNSGSKHDN